MTAARCHKRLCLHGKMAANGRGSLRPHHGSKTPPFVLIGLLVVIAILGFNYWNASSKNSVLVAEVQALSDKMRLNSMKQVSIEKRNEALLEQVRNKETESRSHKEEAEKHKQMYQQKDIDCRTHTENLSDELQAARGKFEDMSIKLVIIERLETCLYLKLEMVNGS